MSHLFIGIDVCKDHLDAAVRPSGQRHRFTNDAAGIEALVQWARPLAPKRILIESTGPYEAEALASSLVLNGCADYVASEDTVRVASQNSISSRALIPKTFSLPYCSTPCAYPAQSI